MIFEYFDEHEPFKIISGQDDEMRKLAREFPIADFWAHSSSGMCAICDDTQKDTFPLLDPKPCLLIEVETLSGAVKISKCERTEKRINFKREREKEQQQQQQQQSVKAAKKSSTEDVVVVKEKPSEVTEIKRTEPSKKPNTPVSNTTAPASSSTNTPTPMYQPPKISATTAWIQFNDALGRNRKTRCDKFAQLLKWSNMDNPKIILGIY